MSHRLDTHKTTLRHTEHAPAEAPVSTPPIASDTNDTHNQTPKPTSFWESVRQLTVFVLSVLIIVVPLRLFVISPFIVSGSSMYPTFSSWDYLLIDRISYRLSEPERGDVIVFRYPRDPKRFFIKRIIGLPGETVSIKGTTVTITNRQHPSGFILEEPYIAEGHNKPEDLTVVLGPTEYFVMGDNRIASADSRMWGPLDASYIIGRTLVRLFPFDAISLFPGSFTNTTQPLSP